MSLLHSCVALSTLVSLTVLGCGGDSGSGSHEPAADGGEGGSPSGAQSTGGAESTGGADTTGIAGGGLLQAGAGGGDEGSLAEGGEASVAAGGTELIGGSSGSGALMGGAAGQGGKVVEGGAGALGGQLSAGGGGGAAGAAAEAGTLGTAMGTAGSSGSSAPLDDCTLLCGGDCSTQEPSCLSEAFGLTAGGTTDTCLPPGAMLTATWCENETCGQQAGCPLTVHIGSLDWTVDPTPPPVSVGATGTITAVDGFITLRASSQECQVEVNVPDSSPIPITATGTLEADGDSLVPVISQVTSDVSQVTLTSATSDVCNTLAALAETSYQDYFTAGLLTVLQARAAALTCLECRPECQAGVACTSL